MSKKSLLRYMGTDRVFMVDGSGVMRLRKNVNKDREETEGKVAVGFLKPQLDAGREIVQHG